MQGDDTVRRDDFFRQAAKGVLCACAKSGGGLYAQAYVIPSHVHLSECHRLALFGRTPVGEVRVSGPKGSLPLAVAGSGGERTTVDISLTDALKIGVRNLGVYSGDWEKTKGCTLSGPKREVVIEHGVTTPARHLHLTRELAQAYGLYRGQKVCAVIKSEKRSLTFGDIVVRIGGTTGPELHLDSDEANAAGLDCGQCVKILPNPI